LLPLFFPFSTSTPEENYFSLQLNEDEMQTMPTELTCSTCGEGRKELFRCSGCKVVLYRSQAHQKKSWRSHKPECLRIQDWRKESAGTGEAFQETPPWAIRRIIECNRNNQDLLDMDDLSLKFLPSELILLAPRLKKVTFRYNSLTYPSTSVLSSLTELRHLDFRYF